MESMNIRPKISCIVCTYNRQDFILQCLEALTHQSLDTKLYEVIVVDNHSNDATAKLVKGFIENHTDIQTTYMFEEKQGLSHARNTGARISQSDILTYIDDDAIADSHLLEEVLRVFEQSPLTGCVGGRIDLALPPNTPWWYSDRLAGYYSSFHLPTTSIKKISEVWALPYGANFSVAKRALFEVGGFSVDLGRKGRDFSGGEEIDLAYRIAANGYDVYYSPFAKVTHYIREDRMNLKHMVKSARSGAKLWVHMERDLMKSNRGVKCDFQNMIKDLIKLLFDFSKGNVPRRFQYFLQALHNYEKVKSKLRQ
jgi:glycosyltransferase involved in cell wall biosynthesis